jgi:PAS domain S-box-containing protein
MIDAFAVIEPSEVTEEPEPVTVQVEETGHAGLAIIDENLRYVEVNDTLARIHGLSPEEHVGKSISEVLPDIASVVEPVLQRILDTGQPEVNVEFETPAGVQPRSSRNWAVSLVPLLGEDGRPHGIGALVLDVTNKRQVEEKQTSLERLELATREMVGQTSAAKLNNRIRLLREVSTALSTAAEVLAQAGDPASGRPLDIENGIDFNDEVKRFEMNLIQRALKQTHGNQKKAAALLRMKHTTLHTKIKRYHIESWA